MSHDRYIWELGLTSETGFSRRPLLSLSMLRGALAATLINAACACATTQAAGPGTANRTEEQARSILEAHRARHEFPGAVMALLDPRSEPVLVTSGTTDPNDDNAAVDANEPWIIGSATKSFVAIVVLQLAQEGKLNLDDSIKAWFPELPDVSRISLRDLLQHTSGLNEYLDSELVQNDAKRAWTPAELIEVAVSRGSIAKPGVSHHYSNTNYIVLGEIIEKVTSRPWHAEVRARILEPLGMSRTGYPGEPATRR